MRDFLKSAFTETLPGKESASFARLATGISVLFSMAWVSHIVFTRHEIPALEGVTVLNSSMYALNRASAFFGKKGDNGAN